MFIGTIPSYHTVLQTGFCQSSKFIVELDDDIADFDMGMKWRYLQNGVKRLKYNFNNKTTILGQTSERQYRKFQEITRLKHLMHTFL